MKVLKFGENFNVPIVLCLGYFGCMHKGHIRLLEVAKDRAKHLGAKVALLTFTNNHLKVLGRNLPVLYTFEERLKIYESLSVDCIIGAEFNNAFRQRSGKEFLNRLCELDLKGVVCGYDHCCGSDRLDCDGIKNYLKDICPIDIVEQISIDNEKISTTLVRRLLEDKKISAANKLLTEPFFLTGEIVHGRGVGKTLGFPTANIVVDSDKFLPQGVYGGIARLDNGVISKCIVNIGATPTFEIARFAVEAHLLDYSGDLYGKKIKLSLTKYLRDIKRFNSPDELKLQLQIDKESVFND